jgi:predicted ATPase
MQTLGERRGDQVNLAEGHLYRGFVHMYRAEFDDARKHLQEAFDRYERPSHADAIYEAQGDTGVMALAYLALTLWNLGYPEESSERSERSLELAERLGGPVTRALAWGMRSILHLSRGEPSELAHWVAKTLAQTQHENVGYWRTVASVMTAWQEGRAGRLDAGIARLEESLEDYLSSGARLSLPHFCIYMADLRLAAGDQQQALEVLRVGEEHIETTGERFAESELFRFKGRVLMSADPAGAVVAYERAVRAAREQNARLLELRAATRLAAHQRALGEPCTVLDRLLSLCDWFAASSELPDVKRARALVEPAPAPR